MQDRRYAVKEGFKKRVMDGSRDAGKKVCSKGGIEEKSDARKEGCRKGSIQNRKYTGATCPTIF